MYVYKRTRTCVIVRKEEEKQKVQMIKPKAASVALRGGQRVMLYYGPRHGGESSLEVHESRPRKVERDEEKEHKTGYTTD